MKKAFFIFCILVLMLSIVSCKPIEDVLYYYNGEEYTSEWYCGTLGTYWSVLPEYDNSWEHITISTQYYESEAEKLQIENTDVGFIRIHDILCVTKDTEMPSIYKNKSDIKYIDISLPNKTITITDTVEIDALTDIILEASDKKTKTNDYLFDCIGSVEVVFADFPVQFFAGRILQDNNGNLFFSSNINPEIDHNKVYKSWYSVPMNMDF